MKRSIAAITCAAAIAAAAVPQGAVAAVTVVVNGNQMSFDQPPVERAGRVFVPLRSIFEALGASVVYQNGVINATGNNRTVSLRINSSQATINGQPATIDVPPFLIGARTLVPLRFVAQALGASVDYNDSDQRVTINGGGGGSYRSTPQPAQNASFYLTEKRPATTAATIHPAIRARFSEPVQRDTLRVRIDGNDVTNDVYGNANGFDVTPSFALNSGNHRVEITGTTQAGATFHTGWTFTTTNGATENFLTNITPGDSAQISGSFTLTGRTLPNSRVHIVASGAANAFGGLFQVGTGTFQTDTIADGNGNFSTNVATNTPGGGQVRVVIQSVSPSGASAERSLTYHT